MGQFLLALGFKNNVVAPAQITVPIYAEYTWINFKYDKELLFTSMDAIFM